MSIVDKGKEPTVEAGVCRCCGGVKRCRLLDAEYTWQGQKEVYCDMFEQCFGIVLSNLEGVAAEKLICAACVSRLRDARLFRQQVLWWEKELSSKHQNETKNKNQEKDINRLHQPRHLPSDTEAESDDDDEDYNDLKPVRTETYLDQSTIQVESLVQSQQTQEQDTKSIENSAKDNNTIVAKIDGPDRDIEKTEVEGTPTKTKTLSRIQSILKKIMKSKCVPTQNSRVSKHRVIDSTKTTSYSPSFLNAVILVENSYACPFNAFNNSFSCIYCKEKFFSADGLRDHTMAHNPQEYEDILRHLRSTNKCLIDLHRIDCRLCDQKIPDFSTFQQHIKVHGKEFHPSTDDDTFVMLMFYLTDSNLNCTECGKVFTYFSDLRHHMAQHFGKSVCEVCGMHFFSDGNMKSHSKKHKPVKDNFTCPICGKTFKYPYCIPTHISHVHNNVEALYSCYDCDESFRSLTLRRKHMAEVHNKGVIVKCKLCDKVFDSKKTWAGHNRRAHLRDFRYQCTLCEKKCFTRQDLKEHMTSHTGERRFHCEHCGKNYPRMKALKVHVRSHMKQ